MRIQLRYWHGWRELATQVVERKPTAIVRSLLAQLKACRDLERGKTIHREAMESGNHSSIYVATALVNMYAKCKSMVHARQVFDGIKHPNTVSWTALILGYVENGEGTIALDLFARMESEGCTPDSVTFIAALKACASLAVDKGIAKDEYLEQGKRMHSKITCHSGMYVQNTLIYMYAKCGSMIDARKVFDSVKHPDVASWTVLILGYAENGEGEKGLDMFSKMRSQGCVPNSKTFVAAIKACTSIAVERESERTECLELGKRIHTEISCPLDIYVQNNLIDMYARCGCMAEARRVFDTMKQQDVVSWTALIMGYAKNGEAITALDLFANMKSQGCAPDCITIVAALKACGLLGALESGRKIHADIDIGIERDAILVTCLVDFYARCGSMVEAQKVFDSHLKTHLSTWNALLAGYSSLGDNKVMFELFDGIHDAGFQPNSVTFSCILACCSHAGLVEKSKEFFRVMTTKYGINPTLEHYNCMVDVFGRSNKLDDAMALLRGMPCRPGAVSWRIALSACRKWKNVEVGRLAYKALAMLDGSNAAPYVVMGLIYKSKGMFQEQEMVLKTRDQIHTLIEPGQSYWTNEAGEVHLFFVWNIQE